MSAPRPFIGINELHLIAKVLDAFTPQEMLTEGFSDYEIAKAERLYDRLDACLTDEVSSIWDAVEVL